MFVGIEESSHLVFEGASTTEGRGLWPLPFITPAIFFVGTSNKPLEGLPKPNVPLLWHSAILFREDFFDPVTRIRRGRFYRREGEPKNWEVSPHPALNLGALNVYPPAIEGFKQQLNASTGLLRKNDLLTFQSFSLWQDFPDIQQHQAVVVLGTRQSPTFWRVLHIETISTGEELVTLKARASFGALPELNTDKIPKSDRGKVIDTVEKLIDNVHRAGPEAVVDDAREAVFAILLARLRQEEGCEVLPDDLANCIGKFEEHQKLKNLVIVINAAYIVNRLHPRRKVVEQERRQLPVIREKDAELAVLCVGVILRDLDWATWP
jgi:hypothetical protein